MAVKSIGAVVLLVGSVMLGYLPPESPAAPSAAVRSLEEFDHRMESLRRNSNIPAISVAIAADQRIAWAKGYGIADLATNRPATAGSAYHFASLTKLFSTAILLQLVQEGSISLDDPIEKYGIVLPGPGVVCVRHLMSHTSRGMPGSVYGYDGSRFTHLDSVIARATGGTFATEFVRRILRPLSLTCIAPNPDTAAFDATGFDRAAYKANLVSVYKYANGRHTLSAPPAVFDAAAGMTGSALDLAAFSIALDRGGVVSSSLRELSYTPVKSTSGATLPYGLGWFTTVYNGERVIWHYGEWTAISSLIVKVPGRGMTFVALANTDALSSPYGLGAGRIESSPWARAFLDAFVFGKARLP
jgi:CubicO group peptidase (beta-lactamase class C family)